MGSKSISALKDDDGDWVTDEDPIDLIDNDGDGLIDEDGKKLETEDLLSIVSDLNIGGNETTTDSLGSGMLMLMQQRDKMMT